MRITDLELGTVGLFGVICDAQITNLHVVDCEIYGYIPEDNEDIKESYAGTLAAGSFSGEILQSHNLKQSCLPALTLIFGV